MEIIRCYDVASTVIEEATKRFSPLWKIDEEKLDIFEEYCDAIDQLAKEFDGESFDVEVNETSMEIAVRVECNVPLLIKSQEDIFYELVKRAVRYSFSVSEDGNLLVEFIFPNLWEKA